MYSIFWHSHLVIMGPQESPDDPQWKYTTINMLSKPGENRVSRIIEFKW